MFGISESKMRFGLIGVIACCLAFASLAKADTGWKEMQKLTASDGAANDWFGYATSVCWDYAIVGAYKNDDAGESSGSAYIFHYDGASWSQQAKLTASDPAAGDYFGLSVSIGVDYAIVGAAWDHAPAEDSGSAYIFKRNGATWTQQTKLTASDATAYDNFGYSVSICGDYAIVGALYADGNETSSGSAYIFKRDGTTWPQQAKLIASDGVTNDGFGRAVAIDGDYAIVGAPWDHAPAEDSGSAYIFKQDSNGWHEQAKLTASDAAADDQFGYSVSISEDYAIVGTGFGDGNETDAGAAYIFKRDCNRWSQKAKLTAPDGAFGDYFGRSVSICGEYAIAGAQGDADNGANSGSAYIFNRANTAWLQQPKLIPADNASGDYFGYSVSIGRNYLIAGALGDDDKGSSSGSAYVFEKFVCPLADLTGDCFVNFADVAVLANVWLQDGNSCETGYADCDGITANGCEQNIYSDVSNCGSCGNVCDLPNAVASCDAGLCVISSCNSGYVDCDGWSSNGCEVNLNDGGGTCAGAEDIGWTCGDTSCHSGPSRSDRGEKWYKLYVEECQTGPGFPDPDPSYTLYVDVDLQSPPGVNYDLYLYEPCGTLIDSSTNGVGQLDQVSHSWIDLAYFDVSRYVYIEIRYAGGSSCADWDLDTSGGCSP